MEGARFGKYVLDRQLGAGGMGEVYLARVEGAGGFSRDVAIKLVKPSATSSPKAIQLFLREGRMLAALNHRNVIGVFDLDTVDERPFLVMEYLRGADLRTVLQMQAGSLPWPAATFIGAEIARALTAAHSLIGEEIPRGIVHGDLSPANVMLCLDGAVKVLDFGIARACGALTTSVGIRGKLVYLPPESLAGIAVDHRADIYALGVTLYRCLTGRAPFDPTNDPAVMRQAQLAPVKPPSQLVSNIPAAVDEAVMKAMVLDRGQRTQTASELARSLDDALGGRFGPADLTTLLSSLGLAGDDDANLQTRQWNNPQRQPDPAQVAETAIERPRRSRRLWWVPAAGLLVLVVAIVLIIGMLPPADRQPEAGTRRVAASPAVADATRASGDAGTGATAARPAAHAADAGVPVDAGHHAPSSRRAVRLQPVAKPRTTPPTLARRVRPHRTAGRHARGRPQAPSRTKAHRTTSTRARVEGVTTPPRPVKAGDRGIAPGQLADPFAGN